MIPNDRGEEPVAPPDQLWPRVVLDAVRGLQFGSVEIVVHDGRVVQVETREKVRFDDAGRRRPDLRGRKLESLNRAHPNRGGAETSHEETIE